MQEATALVEGVCVSTDEPVARVAKIPQPEVQVERFGFAHDRHAGEFRQHWLTGAMRPNHRQWSAVSTDEVEEFCRDLGVEPFPVGALGENIRFSGIRLGEIRTGTIFEFASGCRLGVTEPTDPCANAAYELGACYGEVVQRYFVQASYGRRGVVGVVLAPGVIRPGDSARIDTSRAMRYMP